MATLTITDYAAAEKALTEPDLKQALYDEGAVLMNNVLITLHGDAHRARRTLEMKVFRRDFFRYYENEVLPRVLKETVAPYLARGEADVVHFGMRAMISLAVAFAGIDRVDGSDAESEMLVRILRGLASGALLAHSKLDHEVVRKEVRATLDEFDEKLFRHSAARRQALIARCEAGEIAEDDLPRDVLTILLRNEDKLDFTRDLLLRETAFFYLGGAHTSVHSLSHALHHMLDWCERFPEARAALSENALLAQRFVHESFRLHPSSPVAQRVALAPISFLDGQKAREGDIVVIDLRAANRQQDLFGADADEFNPERVLPPAVSPVGLSFGNGQHACLGRNLAAGTILRGGQGADGDNHQIGTVARIAQFLMRAGARGVPDRPPERDATTARDIWAVYPIRFAAA